MLLYNVQIYTIFSHPLIIFRDLEDGLDVYIYSDIYVYIKFSVFPFVDFSFNTYDECYVCVYRICCILFALFFNSVNYVTLENVSFLCIHFGENEHFQNRCSFLRHFFYFILGIANVCLLLNVELLLYMLAGIKVK